MNTRFLSRDFIFSILFDHFFSITGEICICSHRLEAAAPDDGLLDVTSPAVAGMIHFMAIFRGKY